MFILIRYLSHAPLTLNLGWTFPHGAIHQGWTSSKYAFELLRRQQKVAGVVAMKVISKHIQFTRLDLEQRKKKKRKEKEVGDEDKKENENLHANNLIEWVSKLSLVRFKKNIWFSTTHYFKLNGSERTKFQSWHTNIEDEDENRPYMKRNSKF